MIKFKDGFLVAQTTVKRHENKTKSKNEPTNNQKNKRKIKAMGNMTPTIVHEKSNF